MIKAGAVVAGIAAGPLPAAIVGSAISMQAIDENKTRPETKKVTTYDLQCRTGMIEALKRCKDTEDSIAVLQDAVDAG